MKHFTRARDLSAGHITRATRAKAITNEPSEKLSKHSKRAKTGHHNTDNDDCSISINEFPDELLVKIMQYLMVEDLLVVQEVCQRWERLSHERSIWLNKSFVWHGNSTTPLSRHDKIGKYCSVQASVTHWSKSSAFWRSRSPTYMYKALKQMPQLRICALPFEKPAIEALYTSCPYITKLEIIACEEIDVIELGKLVIQCPLIEILKLPVGFMTDECFTIKIASLKFLEALSVHVDISRWNSLPVILKPLAKGCKQLSKLDLWCFSIFDINCLFKAHPPLEEIALRWTTEDKRCVLSSLLECRDTLKYLQLHEYDVVYEDSFEAFRALGKMNNLNWLEIQCVRDCPEGAMAEAFRDGGLSQLQRIDLSNSWALDAEALLCLIEGCPKVKWLRLFGCHGLTDEAFKTIYKLSYLRRLNISRCGGLGPVSILYIARIPKLRALWLEYTDFRRLRPGIKRILDMKQLRRLYMGTATYLNCVPFDLFPEYLPNLKTLDVQCTKFDPALMQHLKESMPNLSIRYTHYLYLDSDETSDEDL